MNTSSKFILAIALAAVLGPFAVLVWLCYELSQIPDLFEFENLTFEDGTA